MSTEFMEQPAPSEGFVLTHFITSRDLNRSTAFYRDVFGGKVVKEGEPRVVKVANSWILINLGGGPTTDKPEVILEAPADPGKASSFLNIRVADIQQCYRDWKARGAQFITPPLERETEFRCYIRDPDGYLIEVGQSKVG